MIVSIDAEKAFDKIQYPFLIKTLNKLGIRELPHHDKRTSSSGKNLEPTSDLMMKYQTLFSKVRHKAGCLLSSLPSIFVPEADGRVKKIKLKAGIKMWKEVKLSLFTDDMIICTENPKESTKNFKININKFSKSTGHRST